MYNEHPLLRGRLDVQARMRKGLSRRQSVASPIGSGLSKSAASERGYSLNVEDDSGAVRGESVVKSVWSDSCRTQPTVVEVIRDVDVALLEKGARLLDEFLF